MSHPLDVENDPFLILLTDALRAGPGSPQWHEAVSKLVTDGENVDEYKLLIEARQALESGKDYRSIRAGAGFTRKLMSGVAAHDLPAPGRRRISLAGLIAVIAGIVIVLVLGIAIYEFYPRQTPVQQNKAISDLAGTYFPDEVISAGFDSGIPPGWREVGSLPLDVSSGLKPASQAPPSGGYIGGAIVTQDPLPADTALDIQATLRISGPADGLIPQVFVSNSADFSPDRAVSSGQELVWQLEDNVQKVIASGRVESQSALRGKRELRTIRILLRGDLAIVQDGQRRLWAGESGLGNKSRYLGVRFIRTHGGAVGDVAIQSIRVLKAGR